MKKIIRIIMASACIAVLGAVMTACGKTGSGLPLVGDNVPYSECVKLGNYENLSLGEYRELTDFDIDEAITTYESHSGAYKASEGDVVKIFFDGRVEGEAFPGGTGETVVTAKEELENVTFASAVLGMEIDEMKVVKIVLTDEISGHKDEEAAFQITVTEITTPHKLEGEEKEKAIEDLKNNWEGTIREEAMTSCWQQLFASCEFSKLPKSLYTKYADMYEESCKALATEGTIESYLKDKELSEDLYKTAKDSYAEKNAKSELLVEVMAQGFGMEVGSAEFNVEAEELAKSYEHNSAEEMKSQYGEEIFNRTVLLRMIEKKLVELGQFDNAGSQSQTETAETTSETETEPATTVETAVTAETAVTTEAAATETEAAPEADTESEIEEENDETEE